MDLASKFDEVELLVNGSKKTFSWYDMAIMMGFNETQYKQNNADAVNTLHAVNIAWMMFATVLVFFMQAGFTMVEVGSVRIKNTKSILIKNLSDACMGSVLFFFYGWAFAFGKGNSFIGYNGFAMQHGFNKNGTMEPDPYQYALWTFQFTFCATASTIVSGAVAERTQLSAYLIYTFFLVTFIYPPIAHWAWTDDGWASVTNPKPLFGVGAIDFAGVTVVHVTGGTCALIGAFLVGPRQGRFTKNSKIAKQNAVFQVLGTLILWFGWYGFNCGSTQSLGGPVSNAAAKIGVTTTIAATVSGTTTIFLNFFLDHKFDPGVVCNGILAGLVSITGGCSVVQPESAFAIGVVGAHVYYFSSKMLMKLQIDDVVDASPVHFFCGIWGSIATGLFASKKASNDAYSSEVDNEMGHGLFFDASRGGKQLAANLVFLLATVSWAAAIALPLFLVLKILRLLRINNIHESKGLDKVAHGGTAYENQNVNSTNSAG